VSRAALAAAAALALAALALAPEVVPTASGSRAAAADCAWQLHSKRLVRHVKRHGRARRQVRVVHRWICVPQPEAPAAAPAAPAAPQPVPPSEPTPQPEAPAVGRLSVKADDEAVPWGFTLSRPQVAAGEVIVELNNQGGDPHNLNLKREGSEEATLEISEAGPLEHRAGRFTLVPGTYRLWCSLPEHEEKGMHTTLVVGD
jgi:plastocyanin